MSERLSQLQERLSLWNADPYALANVVSEVITELQHIEARVAKLEQRTTALDSNIMGRVRQLELKGRRYGGGLK